MTMPGGMSQIFNVFVRDITEDKAAEEELTRLSNSLRLLLESTGEGIYGLDTQGRCTFINKAAAAVLGYEPAELIGKELHSTIHHSHADGSPYPVAECPTYAVLRDGNSCRIDGEVMWCHNGSSFPAEYSAYPIVEGGVTTGTVVAFSDVSERKRTERELALAHEQAM